MEGQQKRQWGITSAISEAQPTEADNRLNDELVEALKRQNVFESTEGSNNRCVHARVCRRPRNMNMQLTPLRAGSRS